VRKKAEQYTSSQISASNGAKMKDHIVAKYTKF